MRYRNIRLRGLHRASRPPNIVAARFANASKIGHDAGLQCKSALVTRSYVRSVSTFSQGQLLSEASLVFFVHYQRRGASSPSFYLFCFFCCRRDCSPIGPINLQLGVVGP